MEITLDLLGGVNYPKRVREIIDHVAKVFPCVKLNIRIIAYAKGWDEERYKPLITSVLKKPNVISAGIHGLWDDKHIFRESDIPRAKKIGEEFNKIAKNFPLKPCYYSPCLEHEMSLTLTKKFQLACTFPNLIYVNSYIKNGAKLPGVVNEVHHNLSKQTGRYIHSFDGLDQLDVDMNKYKDVHKNAIMFALWAWFCNSKASKKDTTKREDRKLLPQLRMIEVLIHQALMRYPSNHQLTSGRIYKAYAEAHLDREGQADSRSYSMTFLTTARPKQILFKAKGKTLLTLTASGTLHKNQMIYRNLSNPFALDLWEEAKKYNKEGVLNVWEDDKKVGIVHPVFRCGEYKNVDI
jgi:hypothetical protein